MTATMTNSNAARTGRNSLKIDGLATFETSSHADFNASAITSRALGLLFEVVLAGLVERAGVIRRGDLARDVAG